MAYVLNAERLRVVKKNEKGQVTYRKRYKHGDTVDTDNMDEDRVKHFVEKGILVSSTDDLTEPESAGATSPTSPPFGGATVASTPGEEGPSADDQPASDEEHDVDEYDSMDYSALQAEAKSRDLNAGGSAEDLRARLRADDE